jgi:hypothetical protein
LKFPVGEDALFAGEAGRLPLFEWIGVLPCVARSGESMFMGMIGELPFADEIGELPFAVAIGELPFADGTGVASSPALFFPTDGAT